MDTVGLSLERNIVYLDPLTWLDSSLKCSKSNLDINGKDTAQCFNKMEFAPVPGKLVFTMSMKLGPGCPSWSQASVRILDLYTLHQCRSGWDSCCSTIQ